MEVNSMLTIDQVQDLKQRMHLPKVVTDKSVTTYIGSADGITYSLHTLLPGSTSWIYYSSNDDDTFMEQYTILSGELEVERGCEKVILYPGDVIDTKINRTVHTCYAKENVEMLFEMMKKIEDQLLEDKDVDSVNTIFTASNIATVDQWEQSMQITEVKAQLTPLLESFVQGNKLLIPVTLDLNGSSDEAQDWVREWSEKELGVDMMLGGRPKFNQEIFDEIFNKVGALLAIILGSTFIILMIAFRSILIPLKAIIMNVIGLSSTFGILVYIFQYGHFGIEATSIALIIPVIVFSLVFGLSMDYEVFLISRIQEEYSKSLNNTAATIDGLTATSKIITSAALIMIVITGAFAFTDVMPVKQIGIGIAIAVAIDASIIRLLLVPSLMKLFGKWNWWMPFRKGPYKASKWH